jgi:hypothetical protein
MSSNRPRRAAAYPLRLPVSIKREAERLAAEDGASFNQFVASAVAEKIGAMRAAAFFEQRRARADWDAFDRLLSRPGGEPPRDGDRLPD